MASYEQLRAVLDLPFCVDGLPQLQQSQYVDMVHWAALDLEKVISKIRSIEGFQDFEKPMTLMEMKEEAALYPIVFINVRELRCDAIIMNRDKVFCCPLTVMLGDSILIFQLYQRSHKPCNRYSPACTLVTHSELRKV